MSTRTGIFESGEPKWLSVAVESSRRTAVDASTSTAVVAAGRRQYYLAVDESTIDGGAGKDHVSTGPSFPDPLSESVTTVELKFPAGSLQTSPCLINDCLRLTP